MPTLTLGTRLGRYEIRAKLGAGGMADVYLAEDSQLGRRVALKVLPAEDQADEQARKRLEREARAAATLDHPHICAVYEVGEADGVAFIAMQYVEGQTLAARIARGALGIPETLAIACQMADALAEAHEHGVLHRDIKPANIMLTAKGQAKVMDFGLAKLSRAEGAGAAVTVSGLTQPGAIMGTVPYMSPEQVRADELDQRSDLFSAGIVLYEMLCGRRPFDESSSAATASAILTRDPLPVARFAPDTPPELERIVAKALRKNPEERYQTAKDLLIDLRALSEEHSFQARLERTSPPSDRPATPASSGIVVVERPRLPYAWLAGAIVLAAIGGGGWWLKQRADVNAARAKLPQVVALAEARRNFEAYDLAVQVEPNLPGDATLADLMPKISDTLSATTDPPGARVYLKRFTPDATGAREERRAVGTTPLKNLRIARGEYILSIEHEGYAPYERAVSGVTVRVGTLVITPRPIQIDTRLIASADSPAGMVFVPASNYRMVSWTRPSDRLVKLPDFFIGKYEVSNQEFKEFISGGGYIKREFWRHPMIKDGRTLTWEQSMSLLVDRTGLPGPRGWSNQQVPDGKADYPVTDITWYEADAYAAFRGKELPTAFQWEKAARDGINPGAGVAFMPWGVFYPGDTLDRRANFGGSPWPVSNGEFGMSQFGAYNMAGNVSEWTRNDSSDGYLATGGGSGDATYAFTQYGGRPGFFSASNLGFRLAQSAGRAEDTESAARIELDQAVPAYKASPDATFNALAAKYRYAATPLEARIEETIETPDWKREKITFNGAEGERAIAYLYLPHHVAGPVQVIHYLPAGDVAAGLRSITASMEDNLAPFIRSGRAAFGVILKGYIGRLWPQGYVPADPTTVEYFDRIAARILDLRRGLDYLATRPDLDRSRVAILAPSAGSALGLILAAIEPRYRAVAMVGAGLPASTIPLFAAANPINFAPHITAPKLLVQGHYDEDTPVRTASDPLFKLLAEPKRRSIFEGGHVAPPEVHVKVTGPWFDEIMGKVAR
jgi:eukaryotic-like serine/threonine-protein kinase